MRTGINPFAPRHIQRQQREEMYRQSHPLKQSDVLCPITRYGEYVDQDTAITYLGELGTPYMMRLWSGRKLLRRLRSQTSSSGYIVCCEDIEFIKNDYPENPDKYAIEIAD